MKETKRDWLVNCRRNDIWWVKQKVRNDWRLDGDLVVGRPLAGALSTEVMERTWDCVGLYDEYETEVEEEKPVVSDTSTGGGEHTQQELRL